MNFNCRIDYHGIELQNIFMHISFLNQQTCRLQKHVLLVLYLMQPDILAGVDVSLMTQFMGGFLHILLQ